MEHWISVLANVNCNSWVKANSSVVAILAFASRYIDHELGLRIIHPEHASWGDEKEGYAGWKHANNTTWQNNKWGTEESGKCSKIRPGTGERHAGEIKETKVECQRMYERMGAWGKYIESCAKDDDVMRYVLILWLICVVWTSRRPLTIKRTETKTAKIFSITTCQGNVISVYFVIDDFFYLCFMITFIYVVNID